MAKAVSKFCGYAVYKFNFVEGFAVLWLRRLYVYWTNFIVNCTLSIIHYQLSIVHYLFFWCKHRVPRRKNYRLLVEHLLNIATQVPLVHNDTEHILVEPFIGESQITIVSV